MVLHPETLETLEELTKRPTFVCRHCNSLSAETNNVYLPQRTCESDFFGGKMAANGKGGWTSQVDGYH